MTNIVNVSKLKTDYKSTLETHKDTNSQTYGHTDDDTADVGVQTSDAKKHMIIRIMKQSQSNSNRFCSAFLP